MLKAFTFYELKVDVRLCPEEPMTAFDSKLLSLDFGSFKVIQTMRLPNPCRRSDEGLGNIFGLLGIYWSTDDHFWVF